jgi:hypothetical protein
MDIRLFDLEKDYKIAENWWKERNWTIPPKEILSDTGFIVFVDNKPIGAMWLYPINGSKTCSTGFPISDPNSDKEIRNQSIDLLLETIQMTAKKMGYKYIWTTTGINAVAKRLEKHNYQKGDENITQYWGRL